MRLLDAEASLERTQGSISVTKRVSLRASSIIPRLDVLLQRSEENKGRNRLNGTPRNPPPTQELVEPRLKARRRPSGWDQRPTALNFLSRVQNDILVSFGVKTKAG